jgi:hypothetical protein
MEDRDNIGVDAPNQTVLPNVRIRLDGCNRLLSDIFGEPTRLGGWLAGLGFDLSQRETIKRNCLPDLLECFVVAIRGAAASWEDERLGMILERRLGLDGQQTSTLRDLGTRLGISPERVRQLEVKAIKRLRSKRQRRILDDQIRFAATQCAGRPSGEVPGESERQGATDQDTASISAPLVFALPHDDPSEDLDGILASACEILRHVDAYLSFSMLAHVLAGSDGPLVRAVIGQYGLTQQGR